MIGALGKEFQWVRAPRQAGARRVHNPRRRTAAQNQTERLESSTGRDDRMNGFPALFRPSIYSCAHFPQKAVVKRKTAAQALAPHEKGDGRLLVSETGTGQGQIISPLLANVYLHFVIDEWFERDVKPRLRGKAFEIRYADDAVICFQYREDAEKVLQLLPKMFARFGLTLHPEKTRLVEFGRIALARAKRVRTKPDTFDFLAMTHKCALSRRGKFTLQVKTMKKRLRRSLKDVAEWCRTHRHDDVDKQRPSSMPNFAATTSTMDVQRTTAVCGSSIGAPADLEKVAGTKDAGTAPQLGQSTRRSCAAIRCYVRGSHALGPESVRAEDRAAPWRT